MPRNTGPSWICIGAQRAGTTWLWQNLQAHPAVTGPPIKELHYFNQRRAGSKGFLWDFRRNDPVGARWRRQMRQRRKEWALRNLSDLRWDARYFLRPVSDEWYLSLFEGPCAGEITPAYATLNARRVKHIAGVLPHVKVIYLLRDPIERAWSAALYKERLSGVKAMTYLDDPGVDQRSDYLNTIERWSARYPAEQIFIGFMEDISWRPRELLRAIYDFLGVGDPPEWPYLSDKVNAVSGVGSPVALQLLADRYAEQTAALAARFGGHTLRWAERAEALRRGSEPNISSASPERPPPLQSGTLDRLESGTRP